MTDIRTAFSATTRGVFGKVVRAVFRSVCPVSGLKVHTDAILTYFDRAGSYWTLYEHRRLNDSLLGQYMSKTSDQCWYTFTCKSRDVKVTKEAYTAAKQHMSTQIPVEQYFKWWKANLAAERSA